jgi:hypothetical protein
VFLGGPGAPAADGRREIDDRESRFVERFDTLRANMERWRTKRRAVIEEQVGRHGPLPAKAFPARAAILFKLLELDERSIAAVHEKPGSMKIGHYVPGTRVPILSDDDLFASANKSRPIVNLAWHIPQEIRSYLTQHGCTGPVIDIVGPEDFEPAA